MLLVSNQISHSDRTPTHRIHRAQRTVPSSTSPRYPSRVRRAEAFGQAMRLFALCQPLAALERAIFFSPLFFFRKKKRGPPEAVGATKYRLTSDRRCPPGLPYYHKL